MAKSKKNKNKPKLNLTVRDEQRNKLEQMASLRTVPSPIFIEVMADERWKRLAEQQGVAYAKTVAEAMDLKLDMDDPGDRRRKFDGQFWILSPGEKCQSKKGVVEILSLSFWQAFWKTERPFRQLLDDADRCQSFAASARVSLYAP